MPHPSPGRPVIPRLLLVVGVLAGLAVGLAPGRADAATAPAVLTRENTAAVFLSDAGATLVPVVSVTVPAGAWTVSSDVTAINFGAGDFVRCQLHANGTLIDGGATEFLADRVAGLTDVGTITASGPQTLTVACDHDHAAASHDQFYIDAGATLTAVKGGPIKSPGHTPTGSPAVVEGRTTTGLAMTTDAKPVLTVHLPAGSWALTATATAVNFGDQDFTSCSLDSPRLLLAAAETGSEGADAAAAGLDLETTTAVPSGGENVTLDCFDDFSDGVSIDPGAAVTATKVPAASAVALTIGEVALPDQGQTSTVVAQQTLPAGAWRVRTENEFGNLQPNNAIAPGSDFMRCSLLANGQPIDGGATTLITSAIYTAEVVNAGSFTATRPWTLTLRCSHDAAHTGSGHWTALDGLLTAVNKGPIN